ncbi:MAG: L-aspartate oxidase [Bacteroidia bacterium]
MIQTDFLVIGSGIAGLSFALKAAETHKVLVITKGERNDSNTAWAQGGIAAVMAKEDNFENHIQDTLIAGDGLCNEEVVRIVVENAPACIADLMKWGTQFDINEEGDLSLAREGGHSHHRILHAKDATGREIQRALVDAAKNHPNIILTEHLFAIDVITQHHLGWYVNRGTPDIACYGIYALDLKTREVIKILSKITIMCTGGAGNVYTATTNPSIATGDGIAMVYRAMGRVSNMEFNQFHPTSLYDPTGARPSFLITEALRGHGAILKDPYHKQPFMHKYDERLNLAPRDIVARAIDSEMKISGMPHVYLDATHIPAEELKHEFPTIYAHCLSKGIDITKDMIPVVPASHYLCGGILVDTNGKSSIENLYAAGECTCSGLHGANRLASNSLLEGIVYAHQVFQATKDLVHTIEWKDNIPEWNDTGTTRTEEWILIAHNFKEIQNIMSNYVGIVRSNARLERAAVRIELIYKETEAFYQKTKLSPELCELRNIITIAYLIVKSATIRKESRGLHFTTDYLEKAKYVMNTVL